MKDKPLNYRQSLFVKYYTDGETKGNQLQSALKAGYTKKYATQACVFLLDNIRVKEAIASEIALIEAERLDSRVFIDNQFKSLLVKCLENHDRVNATRVLENMAKNRGYYAEDNAQQREKAELSAQEKEEAVEYAKWRLLKGA